MHLAVIENPNPVEIKLSYRGMDVTVPANGRTRPLQEDAELTMATDIVNKLNASHHAEKCCLLPSGEWILCSDWWLDHPPANAATEMREWEMVHWESVGDVQASDAIELSERLTASEEHKRALSDENVALQDRLDKLSRELREAKGKQKVEGG